MTSLLALRGASLAVALVLDLVFGDPASALHPVALLGGFISAEVGLLRRLGMTQRAGGVVLAVVTCMCSGAAALGLSVLASRGGPPAVVAADAVLIYLTLGGRSLGREAAAVASLLGKGDLEGARRRVSRVVGRDTWTLDEAGVARASIETTGENAVDALLAPVFWSALLGPAGAWIHKAASTLDSMVGYRTESFARFGTASAKLDDALAWLPARLAIPVIAFVAAVARLDAPAALGVGLRDRLLHASPNSAHGEAAFAGALRVRLGGLAHYAGEPSHRPVLGAEFAEAGSADVRSAVRLLLATEAFLLAASVAVTLLAARVA